MPGAYNPWDAFQQGVGIGGRMRQQRQQAEMGNAYETGGFDAAADVAGRYGDFDAMEGVRVPQRNQRRFDNEQQQQVYNMLEKARPWVLPVFQRVEQLPLDQRAAWLNQPHIRQRFEGLHFQPEQIDTAIARLSDPATAEETLANLRAAFTQHEDPNWRIDTGSGQVYAVNPQSGQVQTGGQAPVTPDWQTGGTTPYYINPQGQVVTGSGSIPHRPTVGMVTGGAPSGYRWTEGGGLEPIPGGPAQGGQIDRQTWDRVRGLRELESALQQYASALTNYNPGVGEAFGIGGAAADIDSAAQIVATQLNRSAFELGALAGPDYQIIVNAMGDPTNWQNLFRGGGDALRARLATVMQMVRQKRAEQERELTARGIDPSSVMGESNLQPGPIGGQQRSGPQGDELGSTDGIPRGQYPEDYNPQDVTTWPDWLLDEQ